MQYDRELEQMQAQAARHSGVRLSRAPDRQCCGSVKASPPAPPDSDSMLLLGLILILASDGADKMLLFMLLYIFQKN